MTKKIPLLRPLLPSLEALSPYLREIDANRWYTNFGPLVQKLENNLLSVLSQRSRFPIFLSTLSNCTVGLELVLSALALPPSSNILVPGLTFVATATSVKRSGHQLLLADVDPNSWMLTPDIARSILTQRKFSAVIPVATFGSPQDVDGWDRFTEDTGIPVVVDAAGAFGSQLLGRYLTVVFSFHATKVMTSAEGGVVVSGDRKLVESIRQMSNFGLDLGMVSPTNQGMVTHVGTNAKMSEYHAAIALAAQDEWELTSAKRAALSVEYEERLDRLERYLVRQSTSGGLVNSLMVVRLKSDVSLQKTLEFLLKRGVETRRWYCPPIHHHPAFSREQRAGDLVEVEKLSNSILGLPFYLDMTDEDVEYVCASLKDALIA